jgi:hypothetical protein
MSSTILLPLLRTAMDRVETAGIGARGPSDDVTRMSKET